MKTEDIKTWQERLCSGDRRLPSQIVQSEIDELRAALKERDAEIIKIAQDNLAADPGRDGYILPIKFARAIEAAVRAKP